MQETVQEILKNKHCWCKGALAMKADWTTVNHNLVKADILSMSLAEITKLLIAEIQKKEYIRFCISGALYRVYGCPLKEESHPLRIKIREELIKINRPSLVAFNDSPSTTFTDILGFLSRIGLYE